MTAREIFNQCVEEQLFGTCVNIEIKKHSNLAKAHPKGEIHYYRQAMWDIQQDLSTHTLFNSWASCGYGRMFGENGVNANVFDWVDSWMQEEYQEFGTLGLNEEAIQKLYEGTEKRYADLFRSFLPDYVCFHWLNEQFNDAINKSEWSKCLRSDSKIIKAYLAIEEELYEQGYIKDGCWSGGFEELEELFARLIANYYFSDDIADIDKNAVNEKKKWRIQGKKLKAFCKARYNFDCGEHLQQERLRSAMEDYFKYNNRRLKNINIKPQ